ncbi:MAG: Bug family tripartite tricarboxylate transporter substrate binding protein [Methyloligellaceae bacterium]
MRLVHIACAAIAAVLGFANAARAEDPDQQITLIVPYGAGGATDRAAHNFKAVAPKYISQPLNIAHRTGAGGAVGAYLVANAKQDGYTMIVARVGSHTVNPAMKARLPYAIDDFRYVGVFELNPVVCATSPKSGIKTMAALITAVKAKPGQLSYSSSGVGSMLHLAGPLVLDAFDVEDAAEAATHLPFRGGGEAATQVANGSATFICTNSSSIIDRIRSGSLVPLMVTTKERVKDIDAPTAAELGHPELEVLVGWSGIAGPKGLSDEAFAAWSKWLAQIGADEQFKSSMRNLGSIPVHMSPDDSILFIKQQHGVFDDLVRRLGMRVE